MRGLAHGAAFVVDALAFQAAPLALQAADGAHHAGVRGAPESVAQAVVVGHRIPMIARWPEHIPAGTDCDHLIALTDLLATCAGLTGVSVPERASPDGFDCSTSFLDPDESEPVRRTLVHDSFFEVVYALRHGDWKLIMDQHAGGIPARQGIVEATWTPGLLYNLADDPGETENLYEQRPDIVNDLIDRFHAVQGGTAQKAAEVGP
jgi:arylsulfatase A-like enzyme